MLFARRIVPLVLNSTTAIDFSIAAILPESLARASFWSVISVASLMTLRVLPSVPSTGL
ncbi:hypothetical protein MBAV_001675 [Candidatus Magnetobacterium bavaricum]|uniref:Uncharacterized protein n=1 Tax=Candidatus Magnetobacterium bavaricum TaxID=29290 RepID=A0A0F3GW65_9BACT|nr:hypothetical protein MBAV_001675 [Candidatus Magnetobacterium bavaricum]